MTTLSINADRLLGRVRELGQIGRDSAGRLVRLAGSDADKVGRDLFVTWMHNAGLEVAVDRIGNIFGIWNGSANARDAPVVGH
jgi:beta-ureidopropionase / N-carbamoyl-L-amino-acid hydrolase